ITVTELRENTFYAQITVQQDGTEIEVDSRPSDAIALAIRAEAPIFAADRVIEESAIEFEGEDVDQEQLEAEVAKFKHSLEEVTPKGTRTRRTAGTRSRNRSSDWPSPRNISSSPKGAMIVNRATFAANAAACAGSQCVGVRPCSLLGLWGSGSTETPISKT